jgi:ligand-binding SRPBCC domain-containing protein
MPHFEQTMRLSRPVAEVFDFFARPANLVRVSPPELHLRLIEGPERLELGARLTLRGWRWGVPQRVVSEVTAFESGVRFVDEQRKGPFGKWVHTHQFEADSGGTLVRDRIEYEPPGGVLGLVVTVGWIERDLEWIFTYRETKLRELLGE